MKETPHSEALVICRLNLEDKQQKLLFATNAGMYTPTNDPQGLFIANGEEEFPIDLKNGKRQFLYEAQRCVFDQ